MFTNAHVANSYEKMSFYSIDFEIYRLRSAPKQQEIGVEKKQHSLHIKLKKKLHLRADFFQIYFLNNAFGSLVIFILNTFVYTPQKIQIFCSESLLLAQFISMLFSVNMHDALGASNSEQNAIRKMFHNIVVGGALHRKIRILKV